MKVLSYLRTASLLSSQLIKLQIYLTTYNINIYIQMCMHVSVLCDVHAMNLRNSEMQLKLKYCRCILCKYMYIDLFSFSCGYDTIV